MPVDVQLSHKQQRPPFVGKNRKKIERAVRNAIPYIDVDQAERRLRSMPREIPGLKESITGTESKLDHRVDEPGRSQQKARSDLPADDEPWLRYVGAAKVLGVSRGTLEVWLSTRRYSVPYYKIGRNVLFKRSELQNFLESRRRGGDTGQVVPPRLAENPRAER